MQVLSASVLMVLEATRRHRFKSDRGNQMNPKLFIEIGCANMKLVRAIEAGRYVQRQVCDLDGESIMKWKCDRCGDKISVCELIDIHTRGDILHPIPSHTHHQTSQYHPHPHTHPTAPQ